MQDSQDAALVLVADDNALNLELLSNALVPEGIEVAMTADGNGVLEIVSREEPDLILLDVLMPGLDGFETCKRLKENPATKDIPVIFMTSLSETRYMMQGFSIGAVDYVMKPIEHAELLARVRTQLSLRRATRSLKEKNAELEREVQERRAAQLALTDAVGQLERRTEELREAQGRLVRLEKQATEIRMAGGFAHEMRNALASARIRLEAVHRKDGDKVSSVCQETGDLLKDLFLLTQPHVPPEQFQRPKEIFQRVLENEKKLLAVLSGISGDLGRALSVTGRILEYSRQGFEKPGSAKLEVKKVVDGVVRSVEQSLVENGVSIAVDVGADCVLRGDESHFYSILSNLALNARDAVLDARNRGERAIRIEARRTNKSVLLEVTDTGVGIAPDDLPKIFEPFFSTKPSSGTGLGLSMVEKLVSLYDGHIHVESAVGLGTTIRLSFPSEP